MISSDCKGMGYHEPEDDPLGFARVDLHYPCMQIEAALRARLAESEARERTAKAEALAWALARVDDALTRAVADVVDSLHEQIDLEHYAANAPAKEPPIISTGVLVSSGPRAPLVIEDEAAAQPAAASREGE